MSADGIYVHANAELLAQAAAARLIIRLVDAQAKRGIASVVLTGGRTAAKIYQAVRDSPAREAVDWSQVQLWWGDERFLPAGHPDRNEVQARSALLDHVNLDPALVHPMPASDSIDPEAAAQRYRDELAHAARPRMADLPHFDLLLLGVGEDGHIASLFPGLPASYDERPVTAVRGSPKPPPIRLTLTLPAINSAEEVWLIATGADKADAVGMALAEPGPVLLPAAGAHGVARTLWLLDRAAAAEVGPRLRSLR